MEYRTQEAIEEVFNQNEVFCSPGYRFAEYVENLRRFQRATAQLAYGADYVEGIRLNEVKARFEAIAREKSLGRNEDVREGIHVLDRTSKEIAAGVSGLNAENSVAKMFPFITRQDASFYRNIDVCNEDETEMTELDAVIVTKNGIIILEVKSAKEDISITSDGRLFFHMSQCFHDNSIKEKMDLKVRLLRDHIHKELGAMGIHPEIVVAGLLVFAPPGGKRIEVHDQFRQQSYCFRSGLYKRVDAFSSETEYTDGEMEAINQVLQNMATNQKRYLLKFDPDDYKLKFARAYQALADEPMPIKTDITMPVAVTEIPSELNDENANQQIATETAVSTLQFMERSSAVRRTGIIAAASCIMLPVLVSAGVAGGLQTLAKTVRR